MKKIDLDIIKYDLRDTLIYRELTVAAFLAMVIDATIIVSAQNDEVFIYSLFLFPLFFVLMVGMAWLYGTRRSYMKRLSDAGYLIPFSKKDYDRSLDVLEKTERKKFEVCLPGGKKYLAIAAIIITVITGVGVYAFTKVPHYIVPIIMIVFTIYYFVKANQYFYKEELDEKAGNIKKVKQLYIIKLVEFIAIFGVLIMNLVVADYHTEIRESYQYERAMRYYKQMDAERYRLFPDEIPEEAFGLFQGVYTEGSQFCYVYFYGPEEITEEYCEYYANLDESVVIHTKQDSEEYDVIYNKIMNDIEHKLLGLYSLDATIYEFDEWLPAEDESGTEYHSMYVLIESDKVLIGFSL